MNDAFDFSSVVLSSHAERRLLMLGTCHLPERTQMELGLEGKVDTAPLYPVLSYDRWHDYGWVFPVHRREADRALGAGHPELASLLEFALQRGFQHLVIVTENEPIAGIPCFSRDQSDGELPSSRSS